MGSAFSVLDEFGNGRVVFGDDTAEAQGAKSSGTGLRGVPAQASGEAVTQVTFSVEQALDDHVAAIEEPRPPDGKWHPSSLYGCSRKAVYEVRGREKTNPPDARARRVFRVGHLFHQFAQDAVDRQVGGSVRQAFRELPVEIPELNVVGHADGLVQFDSEVWELQEFKSIKSTGFKFGNLPKADHTGQVTPYLRALRDYGSPALGIPPLGDALTRARVAYLSKDDLAISEHTVLWSEGKNDDLVLRVGALEQYRKGATQLPERLPVDDKGKKSWQCEWASGRCSFYTKCWDQDSATAEGEPAMLAA